MIYAIDVMIVLGVACAVWAFIPSSSVPLPAVLFAAPTAAFGRLSITTESHGGRLWSFCLTLLGKLVPRLGRQRGELREHLVYTGIRLTDDELAGLNVLSMVGCAFVFFTIAREFGQVQPVSIAFAGAMGFVLPTLWMQARVRGRQRAVVKLLPEVIDLLALCIGAGLDFLGSLNKVVLLKGFKKEPLIEELSLVMQEIKLGKRRFEALKAMARRVNVPEVSSFMRTLVQADRMGTPIGEVLVIHSEDIRFQRFTQAERAALKAPIKILIPLIFCIMPCVAIIVGAPIFLQFMQQSPFGK